MMIGRKLRQVRIARGMTLTEAARLAQINKGHLSAIETEQENPTIGVLRRIADVIGCEIVVRQRKAA